ncbi:glycosyltransferase involved in cell wall biosynthesis [Arthrobacter pascens]|uniref:glycosyltransferase family 4 protein n=1 Tax=Arthrobacter pascens TaxID=1677 RepID=UPI002863DB5A|nr:glycosyltransferase family 4 protein [Arthrobacter pascens]MDR6555733.1 glycosyltransferase involved in cell wall biosynthesis [Arthrobacter pascens]
MKVVYLHQYFNTADSAGGTRSYEFARRLVRDGHEVHIVTTDRSGAKGKKLWHMSEVEGIRVHSINQPYNNSMNARARIMAFLGFAIRASKLSRDLRGDLVFATSTPLTIVIPALAATLGRRTPMVMEVRDLWPTVPIALGFLENPVLRFLAKTLERVAYRSSSKIIALSQGMAEGVFSTGISHSKVSVIPNLSDTGRFAKGKADPAKFTMHHPELQSRPFVLYAGTFGRVNGVEFMVRLANEYRKLDSNLAFVAIGDGAEREHVVNIAHDLGVLNRNFFVLDPVPKKEMPDLLAAAVACSSWVIPVKELEANSANKIFDAFAAAKPVIINYGGWQQVLLHTSGAGLSLSSTDAKAAAQSLHSNLTDESWLASASEASEKLGRSVFEVELLYGQFLEVLKSAVSKS